MKALCHSEVTKELARALHKPVMYINIPPTAFDDIVLVAPYLDSSEYAQLMCDGTGWLVFDTEAEMDRHFHMTVGDDGPTELNSYSGSTRIYALTCHADGELGTENT